MGSAEHVPLTTTCPSPLYHRTQRICLQVWWSWEGASDQEWRRTWNDEDAGRSHTRPLKCPPSHRENGASEGAGLKENTISIIYEDVFRLHKKCISCQKMLFFIISFVHSMTWCETLPLREQSVRPLFRPTFVLFCKFNWIFVVLRWFLFSPHLERNPECASTRLHNSETLKSSSVFAVAELGVCVCVCMCAHAWACSR